MPRYDYHCEQNGLTLEVTHPMSATVSTWGELCDLAEQPTGDTPADAPVSKQVPLPFVGAGRDPGWSPNAAPGGGPGGGPGTGCGSPGCCMGPHGQA